MVLVGFLSSRNRVLVALTLLPVVDVFLTRLVRLEINHHKNLADLLHGDGVSGKICVLHHLPELVGLDGESSADALARSKTVVLEDTQYGLVDGCNDLLHLRADRR